MVSVLLLVPSSLTGQPEPKGLSGFVWCCVDSVDDDGEYGVGKTSRSEAARDTAS